MFGRHAQQERRRRRNTLDPAAILRDLQDLSAGAPVVHEQYGVGRYVGLQAMQIAEQDSEFLVIEYAGGDRIYVPVASLHLVSRYTGAAADAAPLHKLGTDQWAKAQKRAREQVRDVAADLLDLYAQRQARKASALTTDERDYRAFAAAFPSRKPRTSAKPSTPSSPTWPASAPWTAWSAATWASARPRSPCARAFVAVQAGRQVAVLVPTTLLAEQHAANFRDRFADLPVRIESLSRFRSAAGSRDILAQHGGRTGRHPGRHAPPAARGCALQEPWTHHCR